MSINLARTAEAWWAATPAGLVRPGLPAATTAGLLADRAALVAAIEAAQAAAAAAPREAVPAESVDLLSPVTARPGVVAQAVNYRSTATDSGLTRTQFRRPSSARPRIRSPARPGTSSAPTGVGSSTTRWSSAWSSGGPAGRDHGDRGGPGPLRRRPGGRRRCQRSADRAGQDPSSTSPVLPTFTPAGPWLTLVDAADLARLGSLRLTLRVNGQVRRTTPWRRTCSSGPAQALTLLSRFQPLAMGDLLLTWHPGGTAPEGTSQDRRAARRPLPPATRWKLFFGRRRHWYLRDGDVITATIASP